MLLDYSSWFCCHSREPPAGVYANNTRLQSFSSDAGDAAKLLIMMLPVTSWSALESHQRALHTRLSCFTHKLHLPTFSAWTHQHSLSHSPVSHYLVSFSLFIPCSLIYSLRSFACVTLHLWAFPLVSCLLVFWISCLFRGLLSCLWPLPVLFVCLFGLPTWVLTYCLYIGLHVWIAP